MNTAAAAPVVFILTFVADFVARPDLRPEGGAPADRILVDIAIDIDADSGDPVIVGRDLAGNTVTFYADLVRAIRPATADIIGRAA